MIHNKLWQIYFNIHRVTRGVFPSLSIFFGSAPPSMRSLAMSFFHSFGKLSHILSKSLKSSASLSSYPFILPILWFTSSISSFIILTQMLVLPFSLITTFNSVFLLAKVKCTFSSSFSLMSILFLTFIYSIKCFFS